jgi:crotonobetainyl-CoA:carnitine CoA-transferase CaiB-like acyl-CoA transferase
MRVLEIAGGPAAGFAGLLLAELGVELVKVVPPGGGSFSDDPADLVDEETAAYLDRRKQSVSLDLRRRAGAELFLRLAANADGVVDDLGPGGLAGLRLSYNRLRRAKRDLVVVSISPFGLTGPRAGWEASELVVEAAGGIVQSTGFDGEPPFKIAGHAAAYIAGINAATALFAGVEGVAAGVETGVQVDVSAQECFFQHWARHAGQWAYNGNGTRREQSAMGRQGFPHTVPAADGWLFLLALRAEWEELAFFLGLEAFISHEWSDPDARAARWPEIEPHFYASIGSRSKYDWFADASERGYTFAPVESAAEVMTGPQFTARSYFKPAEIDGRELPCAGLPFPWEVPGLAANRPPQAGEHTRAVLAALAGIDAQSLSDLAAKGVI